MRIIDLAPNAFLPPKDGADRRAWHFFEELVAAGVSGTFVERTALVQSGSKPVQHSPARSWRDHKGLTALVALASGTDYWALKMLRTVSQRWLQVEGRFSNRLLVESGWRLSQ